MLWRVHGVCVSMCVCVLSMGSLAASLMAINAYLYVDKGHDWATQTNSQTEFCSQRTDEWDQILGATPLWGSGKWKQITVSKQNRFVLQISTDRNGKYIKKIEAIVEVMKSSKKNRCLQAIDQLIDRWICICFPISHPSFI